MSNLLKRYAVVEKDQRVIDYNDVISERVNEVRKSMEKGESAKGFVEGLNPPIVEPILDEDGNPVDMSDFLGDADDAQPSDGFVQGLAAKQVVDLEAVQAQADGILEQARQEAQQIVDEAHEQASKISDDARNEGYRQGTDDAAREAEGLRAQLTSEYEDRQRQLEVQYEELKATMEPELVEVITQVFTNAIQVIGEEDQQVILRLVNQVLQNSDIDTDFTVRVGSDDYKFLVQNQGKIYMSLNNEIQMDIVEDSQLEKNQCLIETSTGVINCSLDIQLKSLVKDLKILSCMSGS